MNRADELFTVSQAAALWGISKQAAYQRLNKLVNQVDQQGLICLKAGKRYISRAGIDSFNQISQAIQVDSQPNQSTSQAESQPIQATIQADSQPIQADSQHVEQLEAALERISTLEIKAAALEATTEAQRAHIDSLKAALEGARIALDREQALHMTALNRLPAGRGGWFDWWKRKK